MLLQAQTTAPKSKSRPSPLFHPIMTRLEGFPRAQRPLGLNLSSHIHKDDAASAKTGLGASSGRKVRAKAISMILLHLFVFEGCA